MQHGLDQNPNMDDERILGCMLVSVAYTLRCFDVTQRHEERALLTSMTDRQHMFLQAMVANGAYLPAIVARKQAPAVSTYRPSSLRSRPLRSVLDNCLGWRAISLHYKTYSSATASTAQDSFGINMQENKFHSNSVTCKFATVNACLC